MSEVYYHITDPQNIDSILAGGLFGDKDNQVFLVTDTMVMNIVARDQLFLDRYAVLSVVLPDGTSLKSDRVAEWSGPYHRIAQGPIPLGSITLLDIRETQRWDELDTLILHKSDLSLDAIEELKKRN